MTGAPAPWPSVRMLERMGLKRCKHSDGCTVFIDPANVPSGFCARHHRERPRRQPRVPFVPRSQR